MYAVLGSQGLGCRPLVAEALPKRRQTIGNTNAPYNIYNTLSFRSHGVWFCMKGRSVHYSVLPTSCPLHAVNKRDIMRSPHLRAFAIVSSVRKLTRASLDEIRWYFSETHLPLHFIQCYVQARMNNFPL